MRKLRNCLAGMLFGISTFVNPISYSVVAQENQTVQNREGKDKTIDLEEIITQAKKMQTNEELVKKYSDFYLCDKNTKEIDNISLFLGADWCPNCRSSQRAFGDLYKSEYEKKGDICFFVSEEIEKDETAIKFREKMGVTSLPGWVNLKRIDKGRDEWKIVGRGDEETNLNELKRSIDFNIYNIVPRVELRNTAVLVYSLMKGVDINRFSYDANKDSICVNFDMNKPEEVALALRFDSENCGEQKGMFERVLKEVIKKGENGEGCELDKEALRPLINKYLKTRVDEIDDPKKLLDLVFGMHGQDNLFSTLYDILHDGIGQDTRKTRFMEDEKDDREIWYKIASKSCDLLIPESFKSAWELYIKDGREKFEGRAREYVFFEDFVNETFKRHMKAWVDSKTENKPFVRYTAYVSGSEIDVLFGLKINDKIKEQYKASIDKFVEREKEFYREMRDNKITFVPNNTPEEVFWNMVRDTKYSIVARDLDYLSTPISDNKRPAKKQIYDEIVKFCKDNKERIDRKEFAVYYLDGKSFSMSPFHPFPPKGVGIPMTITSYAIYHGFPTAVIRISAFLVN